MKRSTKHLEIFGKKDFFVAEYLTLILIDKIVGLLVVWNISILKYLEVLLQPHCEWYIYVCVQSFY